MRTGGSGHRPHHGRRRHNWHGRASTFVSVQVGECFLPPSRGGQGAASVSQQDGPQPRAQLLVVVLGRSEGGAGHFEAVHNRVRTRGHGGEEVVEELEGRIAVAHP